VKAQYVGDIGDFGKLLLLKHLAGLGFRLGINWVLTEDDDSSDGKFRDYIRYRGRHCLCCCDQDLLEGIASLAKRPKPRRTIRDLEDLILKFSGNSLFYSEYFDGGSSRSHCDDRAFEYLNPAASELVFFDPDNGIGSNARSSAKHVSLSDLKRYWDRGQSLLIYHHLPQRQLAETVINQLRGRLQSFSGIQTQSYHFRRGTARVYMLCLQPRHFGQVPEPETVESLAPMLIKKSEWARRRGLTGKTCSESHSWQGAN
jgi:hypothetical protein